MKELYAEVSKLKRLSGIPWDDETGTGMEKTDEAWVSYITVSRIGQTILLHYAGVRVLMYHRSIPRLPYSATKGSRCMTIWRRS